MMLNLFSYTNDISGSCQVDALPSNSIEDVLSLIRAFRNERSEDIQDRIIDDLQKKEQTNNKNNTGNQRPRRATKLR